MGIRPSPIFQSSNISTGDDGGLLVNEYLHSISYPNVFGGGDCISFAPRPLEKAGMYAVRQRLVLWHTIRARLRGTPLKRFIPPQSHVAILNMGDGTGIYINRSRAWHARLAFLIKHFIDTRCMNNYQVSGERAEHD